MEWLVAMITNPFFLTGAMAWFLAQVIKTIIHFCLYKKLDLKRMIGDGGMPSGHSATVISLTVMTCLVCGPASAEFGISLWLAIIVCHDATGVRRETEKQAFLITELIKSFEALFEEQQLPEVKLKKFVGHTPVQVFAGILVGFATAFAMYAILY